MDAIPTLAVLCLAVALSFVLIRSDNCVRNLGSESGYGLP